MNYLFLGRSCVQCMYVDSIILGSTYSGIYCSLHESKEEVITCHALYTTNSSDASMMNLKTDIDTYS